MLMTKFLAFFTLNLVLVSSFRYDTFIGWRGATYDPKTVWGKDNQQNLKPKIQTAEKPNSESSQKWIQLISYKPRVFYFHNFATEEECARIRAIAAPWVKRSTVVSRDSEDHVSNVRTSYGTFIKRLSDPLIIDISDRLAMWSHVPPINQEDIQVLRYSKGQKYSLHSDLLTNEDNNNRIATAILYLSNVEEGGETAFPGFNTEWFEDSIKNQFGEFSDCAKSGIGVKPKMGDAILFFNVDSEKNEDMNAWHTGCPVIEGIKWTATFWIHEAPFRPETYLESNKDEKKKDPGICNDWHQYCKQWTENGECDKNKGYMHEVCRLSCNLCTPCDDNDDGECYRSNRIAGGYLNSEDFK